MPSHDPAHTPLPPQDRRLLLRLARDSIRHGLETGRPLRVVTEEYPATLQERRAAFVTLNRNGALRGCIGHLEAIQPLVDDVAENAFAAAFRDPRFPPLSPDEFDDLEIHISVLTPAHPMTFDSEADLVRQLRPGEDGLILEEGPYRGTFLPSVWESLPRPEEFLRHLKMKAGLPPDHWSDRIRIYRYGTESFSDRD
ncbi:MAG TPA: AmmeMemoRadiSam system protein A [Sedimenticola thiotaurini]|uniref:AmmeMemoRadiSam system protein A n=1 Tax=Sedimenticola thiotaurini TaxID=1543721 RepID=A0A831RLY3_9GAMM|nr:AmmeMemoRadiSam system protein A [Sedimenticola thiotaurini]